MADGMPTNPPPLGGAPSSNRNVMIVLSYLWLLALVPLIVEKDDREVQWHAKHGLLLTGVELIFWVMFNILASMLGAIGCLGLFLVPLISIGIIVVHVVAIMKGLKGGRLIIPGVSEYANRF